jgi:hypothetical protein
MAQLVASGGVSKLGRLDAVQTESRKADQLVAGQLTAK